MKNGDKNDKNGDVHEIMRFSLGKMENVLR
jgi:hypothetical protein